MEDNRGDSSGWLVGLVVGAAVGAIVGLLLAPAPGEETRRRIRDAAGKLGEEGRKRMDEARHFADERAGELKEAIRAGRQAYREARSAHASEGGPETGS